MRADRPHLKKLIADVVAEKLRSANWDRVKNVSDVTGIALTHQEGDLHSILRVQTQAGTRWYEVRVKEMYT